MVYMTKLSATQGDKIMDKPFGIHPGQGTKPELNPGSKGLRDRNSPTCTLSQNGYGA